MFCRLFILEHLVRTHTHILLSLYQFSFGFSILFQCVISIRVRLGYLPYLFSLAYLIPINIWDSSFFPILLDNFMYSNVRIFLRFRCFVCIMQYHHMLVDFSFTWHYSDSMCNMQGSSTFNAAFTYKINNYFMCQQENNVLFHLSVMPMNFHALNYTNIVATVKKTPLNHWINIFSFERVRCSWRNAKVTVFILSFELHIHIRFCGELAAKFSIKLSRENEKTGARERKREKKREKWRKNDIKRAFMNTTYPSMYPSETDGSDKASTVSFEIHDLRLCTYSNKTYFFFFLFSIFISICCTAHATVFVVAFFLFLLFSSSFWRRKKDITMISNKNSHHKHVLWL